ncbi:MAG TPA: hypothetical protein VFT06_04225, partial [Flavisolibacter sp.]|nr:hypothetical protein [Flavisolibacter sp.]
MLPDQSPCYRYPGTKPFEAAEHELFKGRDNDINYLSELVSLQNLVVLFGRSGLGKSSLLNAGLVNCLRKDPTVMVLFVRFGAYYDQNTLSPLARLQAQISGESGTDGSNFIYNKLIPEKEITLHHLWYAFKN